jgi:hypothetical protein
VTEAILDAADAETRLLIRCKSNRKLYRAPEPKDPHQRGRRPEHGAKLKLNDATSLGTPDRQWRVEEAGGGSRGDFALGRGARPGPGATQPLCRARRGLQG